MVPEKQVQLEQHQAFTNLSGGAVIAGVGEMLSTGLRFLGNVVMTHILSQSAYGIFVAALTAVSLTGFAASVGLDNTTLRFLSMYRAKGEHSLAAGLIRFVVRVTLISGLLCGAAFFLSTSALVHFVYHRDAYELPFKEISLLVPLIALQLVLASGLQALNAIKWKVYIDRLIQPGLTLILIGIFYMFGLRLEGVILATIGGFMASTFTGRFLLGKASQHLVRDAVPKFALQTWVLFALPLFFSAMMNNISNTLDILVLAVFALPAQVGLYAAADRTSTLVLIPIAALYTAFAPVIAEYYAHAEHEQLANILKVVTKWSLSLSLPVVLCYCVFHEPILSIYSKVYTAGGLVLIIVSLGNLATVAAGPVFLLLIIMGRSRMILTNTLIAIATNVTLALLLVPRFNAIGVAVAVTSSLIVLNAASLVEVYWIMKIHPYRWDILKPIVAGGVAAGVSFLLLHLLHLSPGRLGTLEALGLIIPFVLIYVRVLVLLRFSEEDMIVFDVIRKKLGSLARHKG